MGRPIGFLTDLGYTDDAVGMCKGLMLQRSPDSQIVDVTHEVPPFNVEEAALYLGDLSDFFPEGSVFAIVVLPETGVLPCIAARNSRNQIFVAADNGVLSAVRRHGPFESIRQIDNPECMVYPPSPSFYGRDVIVACAGSLAGGFPLENVGKALDDIRMLPQRDPELDGNGAVVGCVSIIDKNFGNVWTNIPAELCARAGLRFGDHVEVQFGETSLAMPYRETFGMVPQGSTLAYLNSRGRLAFARNQGSLQDIVSVPSGTQVRVRQAT